MIRISYYIHTPQPPEMIIFAVLDVSWTMGLTRWYKTEGFYIYICRFSTTFYAISISNTLQEPGNLFPYQISMKYLNLWLRDITNSGFGKGWPTYWNSIPAFILIHL